MGAGEAANLANVVTNCGTSGSIHGEGEHPTVTKPAWVAAGAFGDPLKLEEKDFNPRRSVFLVTTGNILQA